jgi:uncharacterized protein (TIGR02996 family)
VLAVVVTRVGELPWRKTFAAGDIPIGSASDNLLVLEGADPRHARLVVRDGKRIVVDLESARGTFVNRKRLAAPSLLGDGDEVGIGAYTLRALLVDAEPYEPLHERDAVERDLLAAIAAGDDASRLVYADWLESAGDLARAEFLRIQHALDAMSPDAAGFERTGDRLRELAAGIDIAWRSRVAKRTIESCPAFDFECPKQWSQLAVTDREGVRHCGSCKQDVHYCGSVEEAREHAAQGRCVALDITCARWVADLEPPFAVNTCRRCEVDVGLRNACPRCGSPTPRMMTAGRMVVRTPPR